MRGFRSQRSRIIQLGSISEMKIGRSFMEQGNNFKNMENMRMREWGTLEFFFFFLKKGEYGGRS